MRWLLILGAAGCAGDGALAQAQAGPECAPSDLVCAMRGFAAPVAVGASLPLEVDIDLQGSTAPPMRMMSADPEVVEVAGTTVRGVGPGTAALLLFLEGEGAVVDFLHVWVEAPDRVTLHMVTPEGFDFGEVVEAIQMLPGDELLLSARLFSGTQALLGGSGTEWSVEGSAATLLRDGVPGRARLVAREPGRAKVSLTTLGVGASVDVEVLR